MKITRKLILGIISVSVISVGLFALVSAQNQTMTVGQINRIRVNCVSAKNTLSQLQTNDALLRVNRGQLYEYMTTKLMSRFNKRIENNNLNAKSIIAVTGYYNKILDTFRTDYQSYAEQLNIAIGTDCVNNPQEFYSAVIDTREKRNQVHNDVIQLHQNIGEYKSAFDAFVINFDRTKGNN